MPPSTLYYNLFGLCARVVHNTLALVNLAIYIDEREDVISILVSGWEIFGHI